MRCSIVSFSNLVDGVLAPRYVFERILVAEVFLPTRILRSTELGMNFCTLNIYGPCTKFVQSCFQAIFPIMITFELIRVRPNSSHAISDPYIEPSKIGSRTKF